MTAPMVSRAYDNSPYRCPRDGKRMVMDVGLEEGEHGLTARHWCLHCDFTPDFSPRTVSAAHSSPILARVRDRIRRGRDDSVEVPMRLDLPAVEEVEAWD